MSVSGNQSNPELIDFIINNVDEHPHDIATLTANTFKVTRVTACRYLQRLVADNLLIAKGTTKARIYKLREVFDETFMFRITPQTEDDELWRKHIAPMLKDLPKNIIDICQYGVTETVNNVIDHSGSESCSLHVKRNAKRIMIGVQDSGIGIFNKLTQAWHLGDHRHALLELSKGKLTTDPTRHRGEGIYFMSRLFNRFTILSGSIFFSFNAEKDNDWEIKVQDQPNAIEGTYLTMEVDVNSKRTLDKIFEHYMDANSRFACTQVPVCLAEYDHEALLSRSQAKRLLLNLDKFSKVIFDFKSVDQVGQAFADEIFRVYKSAHPDIALSIVHANAAVTEMVKHAGVE